MVATVLTMPDGAELDPIQAAQYAVQINLGTKANPVWVFVNGLQNYEPKTDPKLEDDTDISSGGYGSMANAGNEFSVDFDGLVKGLTGSDSKFVADPGMWALKVAAEASGGRGGHVHMRHWRTDDLPDAKEFKAAVKATLKGGKANELQKIGGSLSGRGKPKDIVKPLMTVKNLTLTGAVTSFTIALDGGTPTTAISNANPGATAAAVQTAIRALPGQSGASVIGQPGGPYTFTLIGDVTPTVTPTGGGTAAFS